MNKGKLSSKSRSWNIKNQKQKHDVNAKRLYYKNMTRTKQDHDKNMYPKLVLNKLKVLMWDSTFIIYPLGT
jgi:hypothetical protein